MTFHVGQKVVCINGDFTDFPHFVGVVEFPKEKRIYVIRDIVLGFDGKIYRPGLLLVEIQNRLGPKGVEYNFDPCRFRPLVERKSETDISFALDILGRANRDARQKEPERA